MKEKDICLGAVYLALARMHNKLGMVDKIPVALESYNGRPYRVLHAGKINKLLWKNVHPYFKKLRHPIGSVDMFIDHTKLNHLRYLHRKLKTVLK